VNYESYISILAPYYPLQLYINKSPLNAGVRAVERVERVTVSTGTLISLIKTKLAVYTSVRTKERLTP